MDDRGESVRNVLLGRTLGSVNGAKSIERGAGSVEGADNLVDERSNVLRRSLVGINEVV